MKLLVTILLLFILGGVIILAVSMVSEPAAAVYAAQVPSSTATPSGSPAPWTWPTSTPVTAVPTTPTPPLPPVTRPTGPTATWGPTWTQLPTRTPSTPYPTCCGPTRTPGAYPTLPSATAYPPGPTEGTIPADQPTHPAEPGLPTGTPTILPTPAYPGTHLTLGQAVSPGTAEPGQVVTVQVSLLNDGTDLAPRVVMEVQFPAYLQPGDIATVPAATTEWKGKTLWVAWGDLPAGTTVVLKVNAIMTAQATDGEGIQVRVQDYGLEEQISPPAPPPVLPSTGVGIGWTLLGFAGLLLAGGLLLRRSRR